MYLRPSCDIRVSKNHQRSTMDPILSTVSRPRNMTKWMHAQLSKWINECIKLKVYDLASPEGFEAFQNQRMEKINELRQIEMDDTRAKASLEKLKDIEAQRINLCIQQEKWEDLCPMWGAEIKSAVEKLAVLQKGIKNRNGNGGNYSPAFLVTVNPDPKWPIEAFKPKVEKYARSKMIRKIDWCFEQRGTNPAELGKGMHCHMVVTQTGTYPNGVFMSNTRRAFKNFVGNERHVDIRPLKSDEDVRKASVYIAGTKDDTDDPLKGIKCQMDVAWRADNNLLPLYTRTNKEDIPDGVLIDDLDGNEAQANREESSSEGEAPHSSDEDVQETVHDPECEA